MPATARGVRNLKVTTKNITMATEPSAEPIDTGVGERRADGTVAVTMETVDEEEPEHSEHALSRSQLCTFIGLALALIMDNASYYMKEPFFPVVAKDHGLTESQIGLIFGIHFLVALVCSPIVGKSLPVIGTRAIFLTGLFIGALTDGMFIIIGRFHSRNAFFVASIGTECFAAIGSAATDTAALAIVAQVFPNNVAKMIGMVETFSGIACLIGHPIGGVLYELGGYELPFVAFVSVTTVCLVINIILLPSTEKTTSRSGSVRAMIRIPDVYPICLFIFTVAFCDGVLQPVLALRADELNLTAWHVGLLFLLQGVVYTIFASMCGCASDYNGSHLNRPMALVGLLIVSSAFLIMGPSPIFPMANENLQVPLLMIGLACMGLGLAMSYIPTYPELIAVAFEHGMINDLNTQGVAAGISMSSFCLGSFIGPIVGSSLYQFMGFAYSTTIVSSFCLLLAFLISIYYFIRASTKT